MARVVLENLGKCFQGSRGESIQAVQNVNLIIEDQEFVVLVGPSGCGKTTTLRLIAGLEEVSSGRILLDGLVVNEVLPKDRDVAMVFQNYALYPHLTVYENLAFGLMLRKLPKAEIEPRVKAAAKSLGLAYCLDRLPKALSGGQRQRVALGRAMVRKPKVFLLDEPLSNLDATLRLQLRREISHLRQSLNTTMIYVTHDQVEAMTLGDRIAVMRDGQVQQVTDPMTLYTRPANLFVAGFIGSPPMNFLRGTLVKNGRGLGFQTQAQGEPSMSVVAFLPLDPARSLDLEAQIGKPIILGLRPEHISLEVKAPSTLEPQRQPRLEATVTLVEPMGSETYLHLDIGQPTLVARVPAGDRSVLRQKVWLVCNLSQAHFFDAYSEAAIS